MDVIAVAVNHASTEVRKFRIDERGARMMGRETPMFGCEAEGDGDVEFGQCIHLSIEPGERVRAEAIGPRQTGAEMSNAEPP